MKTTRTMNMRTGSVISRFGLKMETARFCKMSAN